jgi:hypothetical protein
MDKMTPFKVPHDRNGNQITYCSNWQGQYETDPYELEATLKYVDYERGRSALNVVWEDVRTGLRYRSGMPLLHKHLLSGGTHLITGRFGFKKQGTSILLTKLC